ncbi:MAG: RNA polymerase factor sigma-54 [Gammaproteobacteria bacterium]|nr:RNA polymerase factor sigma-54 [Gammaproteobacteria bacterium]MDH5628980.1 RNA polymerase factor sigma-54 [Gammaproteobacteria bacterium]
MKQALHLKLSQSLTMTPQLQQAIKLLQLSSLDLQGEIQEYLDSNPLLESDNGEEPSFADGNGKAGNNYSDETVVTLHTSDSIDTSSQLKNDRISEELESDTKWEDWGYSGQSASQYNNGEDSNGFDYQGETVESLQDQLQWQIDMMNLSEVDYAIAKILIDSIDDKGYLNIDKCEVVEILREDNQHIIEADEEIDVGEDEVQAIIHLIQSFEPAGIGARNIQECLQLQLKRFDNDFPGKRLALQVVDECFDHLSNRNYKQIQKALSINEDQLKHVINLIKTLDPRPGNQVTESTAQYIVPDVFVTKDSNGEWYIELNKSCTPKLKINSDYASLIKRADNTADNMYLKNNLQDAKWFIKSLQSRNETLLKVSTSIVDKQIDFLEHGEEAMKPLVLADVAAEVDMHESTISRVTTQKYMHTPRGIFELKYFFSSHVGTQAGGECSSTAIRAVLKKLIGAENPQKPLSDSKLANLLKDQGINVARRTIAKYREAMMIPPSNERKQLI